MADFTNVLDELKETQSFFKRESQEYKDFRDALANLNKAMIAAGNRALTAGQLQNLRVLTAKARETWGAYIGSIQEKIQSVANQENPTDPLTNRDKRRLVILNGMTELLDGDLDALRNADPQRGLNLEQVILENRGFTADIRGKKAEHVGGAINTRTVLEVNGRKGAFTEDYTVPDPEDTRREYARKYPLIGQLLMKMGNEEEYRSPWMSSMFESPEDLAQKILSGNDVSIKSCILTVTQAIKKWKLRFPQELQGQDGKKWFSNPEFVRQFSDAIYHISHAKDAAAPAEVGFFEYGKNVPRRNAAMSAVADRLGLSDVIARSKVMKIKTDGGDKTGVFMEWADGTDLDRINQTGELDKDFYGKKRKWNSGKLLKSAANLQVLDFICGNVDRHGGNMLYQFENINGVMTLTGLKGIDNDSSFGHFVIEDGAGPILPPEKMRIITKSAAEAVLALTEEELKYSLYGLVDEREIGSAWERTKLLQDELRRSLSSKWKSDHETRPDMIRVLDDDSPAWEKLNMKELYPPFGSREAGGLVRIIGSEQYDSNKKEKSLGLTYQDHTREGVRRAHYKETDEGVNYGPLRNLAFPVEMAGCTDDDVFALYRRREEMSGDEDLVRKGCIFFDRLFFSNSNRFSELDGNINRELGMDNNLGCIYIDGMKVSEYVKKYSPENADNKFYQKAQVIAALTSGRHHVDYVTLRTDEDGHFRALATEMTLDLSPLDGKEHVWESTRENRRKSLLKDEDTRLERQSKIEQEVEAAAEAQAGRKVEELIQNDPVRNEVFRTIPYRELYNKSPKEVEDRLDREVDARERARLEEAVRRKSEEIRKTSFDSARRALEEGAPQDANPRNVRRREPVTLEALNLEKPKKPAAPAVHAQEQQDQAQKQGEEAGIPKRRRNSVNGRH